MTEERSLHFPIEVRWMRALFPMLAVFVTICASYLAWKDRASILSIAAYKWVVSDTLGPADAIVVLGGGRDRPYAAAQLYRRGLANQILVDNDRDRRAMIRLNVPPQAVASFGIGLRNTYEEACALADWAGRNSVQRFIIPTELSASRRVKWIFDRKLREAGGHIMINVTSAYSADNWWLTTTGRDQFRTELVKYLYYRIRYLFAACHSR